MRWSSAMFLLAITASTCQAQELAEKCAPTYQNNNMVDYGPLVFRNFRDAPSILSSARNAGACLGLFTDDGSSIGCSRADGSKRQFSFAAIVPGRYRLVVDFRGFCLAKFP